MDEQMIEHLRDARRTLAKTASGLLGSDELTIPRPFFDSVLRNIDAAIAAHSVIAGKVAELTWLLKGREAAMRWVYENGMVPDHDRPKWVSEQFSDAYADKRAALAPYPERRSE